VCINRVYNAQIKDFALCKLTNFKFHTTYIAFQKCHFLIRAGKFKSCMLYNQLAVECGIRFVTKVLHVPLKKTNKNIN